jgi:hypothetical protein
MPLTSDERFAALMEALTGTEKQLEQGETIYKDLKRSVRRIRLAMWVAIIGLVADLVLTGGLVFGYNRQAELGSRISANQDNVHTVECDLNSVLITADTPQAYAKAFSQTTYIQQFHVIYQNRVQLNCQPPMPEPSRPAPVN